jgi:hypothetical protein
MFTSCVYFVPHLSLQGESLIDPHVNRPWKLHPKYGVWCGGSSEEQPILLEARNNPDTMEEELIVRATGEILQPIDPKRIFNTDEKPCVLSRIHGETIVFSDVSSPTFVPQQKRETNCTLTITSRGDGKIVGVTVILPSSVKRLNEEVVAIFERAPDINVAVVYTDSGLNINSLLLNVY